MPRRCNDCKHTTDTHADRCPKCGGYMAIVCRTGGNASPEDDPRGGVYARPGGGSGSGRPSWVVPAVVVAVVLIGVLIYLNSRGGRHPGRDERAGPTADQPAARIALGAPVRDAVLALEPEPDPNRRVTLHDLLGPNAPKSGHFTFSDGRRTTTVRFRNGKVTSVNESHINYPPGMAGYMPEAVHVTITADDEDGDPNAKLKMNNSKVGEED